MISVNVEKNLLFSFYKDMLTTPIISQQVEKDQIRLPLATSTTSALRGQFDKSDPVSSSSINFAQAALVGPISEIRPTDLRKLARLVPMSSQICLPRLSQLKMLKPQMPEVNV